jgi:high-affinity Fe2+/Pb2+ permease
MRLHKLAVPIAAYLAITLVLPIANGAAGRTDFLLHAATILGGCGLVVATVAGVGLVWTITANKLRARRVLSSGGKS